MAFLHGYGLHYGSGSVRFMLCNISGRCVLLISQCRRFRCQRERVWLQRVHSITFYQGSVANSFPYVSQCRNCILLDSGRLRRRITASCSHVFDCEWNYAGELHSVFVGLVHTSRALIFSVIDGWREMQRRMLVWTANAHVSKRRLLHLPIGL